MNVTQFLLATWPRAILAMYAARGFAALSLVRSTVFATGMLNQLEANGAVSVLAALAPLLCSV